MWSRSPSAGHLVLLVIGLIALLLGALRQRRRIGCSVQSWPKVISTARHWGETRGSQRLALWSGIRTKMGQTDGRPVLTDYLGNCSAKSFLAGLPPQR